MTEDWGSPDRYYAEDGPNRTRKLNRAEMEIGRLLEKRFPNLERRVERTFKESNALIREHLRTETGLKLSIDEKRQTVPVRVVAGIPDILLRTLDVEPEVLELYLDLSLLKTTAAGLARTAKKYAFLEKWLPMTGHLAPVSELKNSQLTIEHLCSELEKLKIFDLVWKIEEDVLGAYFFHQHRIELYWMPIGLIAVDLDVTPEALTQVVAIHELAHAYTHLGFDIDDLSWNTNHFAKTSLHVIEGVAQFFTNAVCMRLESRYSDVLEAFKALLGKQSAPYKTYLDWVSQDEAGGEVVRNALIMFRSRGGNSYGDFIDMIQRHKALIGKRMRRKEPNLFDVIT
jgi:hypothetical protein